ncbi:ABC transporter ATP-binding protein [Pseudooceanicola sediminis]|uniref:ABC transporter ATP-binding protein n=1 Tax=Pseudooceanicola sediminis TaxID=2211117 RepID=A0A399J3L8_9RHOB|nr:ABC transporter ATP-binding protein [Pseudooceanicola sediminis]KAA2314207.1 ABC transporter ATP-binding protein [Puniceibacterium sp. HSS470]RII39934.1 ABC transporter ATP-binding protein [Pseudooceanicola sediminis]|tara:strand:- start:98860 stop:99624 length:765 start_codon:yes stop_codon:yes gene_type:complete
MTQPSLITRDLTIRFGGHVAVNAVSCAFHPGELTVIVGPNGAGKTTYFNLISGQLSASSGQVIKDGVDLTRMAPSARAHHGIGRAFQLTNLFPALSVLENIRLAVQARAGMGWRMLRPVRHFRVLSEKAEHFLEATRLGARAHQPAALLPHGDQRKLEVALLMAMEPDVYMFDEPTAGMSLDHAPEVLELIAGIKRDTTKTVLLVEHKMEVVRALADRIIVLHNGELLAQGDPAEVMASQLVRDVYLGKSEGVA